MRGPSLVLAGVVVAAIACGGNGDQGGDVATAGASSLGHAAGTNGASGTGNGATSASGGKASTTGIGGSGAAAGQSGAAGSGAAGAAAVGGASGATAGNGGGTSGSSGASSGSTGAAGGSGMGASSGSGGKAGTSSTGGSAGTAGSAGSTAAACDPVAQNCLDAIKNKCSLVLDATSTISPACVAPVAPGTGKPGDTCTLQKDGTGMSVFGSDTCQKGSICTDYGVATGIFCRQFCHHTKECAVGSLCDGFDSHHDGACFPTCAPFGATCGASGTCATFALDVDQPSDKSLPPPGAFVCRALGKGKDGDTCAVDDDCLGGMLCVAEPSGGQQCRPMCDATHDCALDPVLLKKGTCEKTLGYAAPWDGIGWCLPPVP